MGHHDLGMGLRILVLNDIGNNDLEGQPQFPQQLAAPRGGGGKNEAFGHDGGKPESPGQPSASRYPI